MNILLDIITCVMIIPFFTEDCSEPNFQLTASQIEEMDPVTLHIQETDKVTMQAVQLFAKKVVMILHTCNEKEYWAALERLQPPTTDKVTFKIVPSPTHKLAQ